MTEGVPPVRRRLARAMPAVAVGVFLLTVLASFVYFALDVLVEINEILSEPQEGYPTTCDGLWCSGVPFLRSPLFMMLVVSVPIVLVAAVLNVWKSKDGGDDE